MIKKNDRKRQKRQKAPKLQKMPKIGFLFHIVSLQYCEEKMMMKYRIGT